MQKTTVYIPPKLKRALTRAARLRRCSEAELLREAVQRLTGEAGAPAPKLPLFRSSGPPIAEDLDLVAAGDEEERPWLALRGRGRWTGDPYPPAVTPGEIQVRRRSAVAHRKR